MKPPILPHLPLIYHGLHEAKLLGGGKADARVKANQLNRAGHSSALRNQLAAVRAEWERISRESTQKAEGLPVHVALAMPERLMDLDFIERKLGLELVSENAEGLMLTIREDGDLLKLEGLINDFAGEVYGSAIGASILEISGPEDIRRLEEVLDEKLLPLWPFKDEAIMILDVMVEVPHHPGYLLKDGTQGPRGEADAEKTARKIDWTDRATQRASEIWERQAEARVAKLREFVHLNNGVITQQTNEEEELRGGLVYFADAVMLQVEMSGLGFRDLVRSFPVVRVEHPAELPLYEGIEGLGVGEMDAKILEPEIDSPAVCVIDSGIQEGHLLLAPAILPEDSKCFIPDKRSDDTADEVRPSGHGTKVAGAVLYPAGPPVAETVQAVAWLQNARVLNDRNTFEEKQNPLLNLQDIVRHYRRGPRETRLFVHSIAALEPCRLRRMTSWAALLDTLSHHDDVLFFQAAGNIKPDNPNPFRLGVKQHLAASREYPGYLEEDSARIAQPAQSLQAITVGSITQAEWVNGDWQAIGAGAGRPSAFSRSGLGMWGSVKPDLVEFGGDYKVSTSGDVSVCLETAPELVQSTLFKAAGVGKDVGTSYAAPKVAHIAAVLQRLFPNASTQLYRALIINSTQWPRWAEAVSKAELIGVLRTLGYGIPSLERATENTPQRVTLITTATQSLRNGRAMVFAVPVPIEMRDVTNRCNVRIDVTLAYSAEPRQTRASRYGYLETWLGWISSYLDEPMENFIQRATKTEERHSKYKPLPWKLREKDNWGDVEGASRQNGTAQKDWAIVPNSQLPEQFCIAVQAHKGWNREDYGGHARFALVVTFEVMETELPIYNLIQAEVEAMVETSITT